MFQINCECQILKLGPIFELLILKKHSCGKFYCEKFKKQKLFQKSVNTYPFITLANYILLKN